MEKVIKELGESVKWQIDEIKRLNQKIRGLNKMIMDCEKEKQEREEKIVQLEKAIQILQSNSPQ